MKKWIVAFLMLCAVNAEAATKTWQNGGVDNNWSTAGNWVEGSKPANGDDVVMSAAYNCIVNEATANLKSFDMTGYANTLSGTSAITVIGAASSTVDVKFAGTVTWTGQLNLNPTANDTDIKLTSNGKTITQLVVTASTNSGEVFLIDNLTMALSGNNRLYVQRGVLHTDGTSDNAGLTHSIWGYVSSGGLSQTLNLGNSSITIYGNPASYSWYVEDGTGAYTLTSGNSTITFSAVNPVVNPGGNYAKTFHDVNFIGGGIATLNNSPAKTFNNLTVIGTTVKSDGIKFVCPITVTGILTLSGNSSVNRLLVYSDTLGTQRKITVNGATITASNVDFRDIMFTDDGTNASSPAKDLASITGGSGNCGGNSGITFTTAVDQDANITGTSKNWSDSTIWTSRVPLPQDNVTGTGITGTSTLTADMPRIGKTIDFSGVPSESAFTLAINSENISLYGGLNLTNVDTLTQNNKNLYFEGRGVFSITSNGTNPTNTNIYVMMVGGTWQLTDDFNSGNTRSFYLVNGTVDSITNNVSLYISAFLSSNSNARAVNISSNGLIIQGQNNGQLIWDTRTSTNLTVTSLPLITLTGNQSAGNFSNFWGSTGQNLSTTDLVINGSTATGGVSFNVGFTWDSLTINAPKTVKFTDGTTTTVNSLVATGDASNHITLTGTSTGGWTITDANGGTNVCDYLDVTYSTGTPSGTWYYGANGSADAWSLAHGWAASPSGAITTIIFPVIYD